MKASTIICTNERLFFIVIPAFSPTRPNPTHYHTNVVTEWVEILNEYPIPDSVQKHIDALNRFSGIGWKTRDNHKKFLHNLLW